MADQKNKKDKIYYKRKLSLENSSVALDDKSLQEGFLAIVTVIGILYGSTRSNMWGSLIYGFIFLTGGYLIVIAVKK